MILGQTLPEDLSFDLCGVCVCVWNIISERGIDKR